jgi:hypothetical protein
MKKVIALFVLGSMILTGCPKHEVIPAPEPEVDLEAKFTGNVNGANIELTENVEGFYLDASKVKTIQPSPTPSTAVYYADFKSGQTLTSIKVNLGSLSFDASVNNQEPLLETFNSFFTTNNIPSYSYQAASGFEVIYRDNLGQIFRSNPTLGGITPNVAFTNIVQESDNSGDYSKFTCTFKCTVFNVADSTPIIIDNAVYKGWFKR